MQRITNAGATAGVVSALYGLDSNIGIDRETRGEVAGRK